MREPGGPVCGFFRVAHFSHAQSSRWNSRCNKGMKNLHINSVTSLFCMLWVAAAIAVVPGEGFADQEVGGAAIAVDVAGPGSSTLTLLKRAIAGHDSAHRQLRRTRGLSDTNASPVILQKILQSGEAALAGALEPGALLLLYFHDGDVLHVWAAGEQGVVRGDVTISSGELGRRVGALRDAVRYGDAHVRGITRSVRAGGASDVSRLAADWLFPGQVAGAVLADGVERIIVVPWGVLSEVPFGVVGLPGGSFGGAATPLISKASVVIAPGLLGIFSPPVFRGRNLDSALVVGNPAYAADSGLPPLPGAEREARSVAALFGATPVVGKDAGKELVMTAMSKADLVYFATHGIVDPDKPLDGSYVALAGGDALTAREIQWSHLREGAVVVLSACDSGRGRVVPGGTIGLARGFQIAGSAEVVMSLWPVDDEATASMMVRLAQGIREGKRAEDALRSAMRDQMSVTPAPGQWAPFTVLSNPVVIADEPDRPVAAGQALARFRFVTLLDKHGGGEWPSVWSKRWLEANGTEVALARAAARASPSIEVLLEVARFRPDGSAMAPFRPVNGDALLLLDGEKVRVSVRNKGAQKMDVALAYDGGEEAVLLAPPAMLKPGEELAFDELRATAGDDIGVETVYVIASVKQGGAEK